MSRIGGRYGGVLGRVTGALLQRISRTGSLRVASDELELNVEELEEVIAPGYPVGPRPNHNETFVRDGEKIELEVEELEEVIAPGIRVNHNETLVRSAE